MHCCDVKSAILLSIYVITRLLISHICVCEQCDRALCYIYPSIIIYAYV